MVGIHQFLNRVEVRHDNLQIVGVVLLESEGKNVPVGLGEAVLMTLIWGGTGLASTGKAWGKSSTLRSIKKELLLALSRIWGLT